MKLSALADNTPSSRLRYLDAFRTVAILVVVFGHWLIMTVWVRDGEILGFSALPQLTRFWPLTWVFQVMPLFFLVGGIAGGISWSRTKARGIPMAIWLLGRLRRLLPPALIVLGLAVIGALIARPFAIRESLIEQAVFAVTMPMWFLVVYLLLIMLTPAMYWLHKKHGLLVIGVVNTSPPTVALLALVLMQVGAAWLLSKPVQRLMERNRTLWTLVIAINSVTMTLFVWHMVAALAGALLLNAFDRLPHWYTGTGVGSAHWWQGRILWFAVLIPILALLVAVFGRLEAASALAKPLLPHNSLGRRGRRKGLERAVRGADTGGASASRIGSHRRRQVGLPITLATIGCYLTVALGLYLMASSPPGNHGPAIIPTSALALVALGAVVFWLLSRHISPFLSVPSDTVGAVEGRAL
ncbi:MAG: acyltransferase [Cellulomonadaceae bacterium]|jgi:hypothetical protein|nr:acyltransferase [Cellulomonadaceae bacterium]